MNNKQRWASKASAEAFMSAYEHRVDTVIRKGDKRVVIPGPKGLSYWAAHDFVYGRKAA